MSAQRLRDAAKVLRERASSARAGKWVRVGAEVEAPREHWTACVATCVGSLDEGNVANATYIATMHPGVALALADWLTEETVGRPFTAVSSRALAVANLILRSQP